MAQVVVGQLGYVDTKTARLFVAASQPGRLRCQIRLGGQSIAKELSLDPQTYTGVVRVEDLETGFPPLSYQWQVQSGKGWKDATGPGAAGAVNLPASDNPERLVIGLTSCNNVLSDYPPVTPDPQERWRALTALMNREQLDFLVHVGDQVYLDPLLLDYMTDTAGYESDDGRLRKAISGWPEQVRQRYLAYFSSSVPGGIQDVLAARPSIMMWDDHELYDGWGSDPHPTLRGWKAWGDIAKRAFQDFQASHNPDPIPGMGFGFAFRRGKVGFLSLDLRSFRGKDPAYPILGKEQLPAAEEWWEAEKDYVTVLLVVSSTPIGHLWGKAWQDTYKYLVLPQWRLDLKDLWSSPVNGNVVDLQRFLDFLTQRVIDGGRRKVLILSGDVHMSHPSAVRHTRSGGLIHEFVCSAICNEIPGMAVPTITAALESQCAIPPRIGEYELLLDHPFILERNFGQVIIETHGTDSSVSCLVHAKGQPAPILGLSRWLLNFAA